MTVCAIITVTIGVDVIVIDKARHNNYSPDFTPLNGKLSFDSSDNGEESQGVCTPGPPGLPIIFRHFSIEI